jgi:AraC-like DNA-binding protein
MDVGILSNLVITDVSSVSTLYTTKGTRVRREGREGWAFVLKYEGETVYICNGKRHISDSSSILLLPRGCSYEWCCTRSGHFLIVEFQCDATHEEILCFAVKESDRFLQDLRAMEQRLLLKRGLWRVASIRDVYSILLRLVEESEKRYLPNDKKEKIAPAIEYIATHYTTTVTNDDLASLCGVSTVYFRKLFEQIYNTSPIAYVQDLRIKKAKEMLETDYGSIGDIALSLGYKSIYDFSRAFKKHTSLSPSRYRAQRGEKKIL